jgi:hypothetical protein
MIKLVLHSLNGSKSTISFADLTHYTNWLINNGHKFSEIGDLKYFEVTEGAECDHVWSICRSNEVRFEFTCAYGCGGEACIEQDEITALQAGR